MADHPTNTHVNLLDGAFYAHDPHPHFQWMRENAPVYWDETSQVWGIALYDDIMRVSKEGKTYSNAQGMRPTAPAIPSMINFDDPYHKRRRNLVNKGFTKARTDGDEPKVRRICIELIEAARAKGEFDFVRDVAAPLPMIMIGDMLGVAPEDRDDLLRWSDDLIAGTSESASPDVAQRAMLAFQQFTEYHAKVVTERRARPTDDLISLLIGAEIDGERLDDEALMQESLLILIGGDETTRHAISGGMYALLRNPGELRKLADDPSKLPVAVEEVLRWTTPIQNMSRTLTRDVELRGQKLREGEKLVLLYPSGNRDADVFEDPHRFDVERQPNEHVAFGGYGTHHCLGANLARLEMRTMFEEILRRIPDLELASDEPPSLRPSNFITGIEHLPVRVA